MGVETTEVGRLRGRGEGAVRTLGGMSRARSGMCRSPMTRMRNAMITSEGRPQVVCGITGMMCAVGRWSIEVGWVALPRRR